MASNRGILTYNFQTAHPFGLFDFFMGMVRNWCHENLVSFLALVVQLLPLHHLSFLLGLLVLPVFFMSLLDIGDLR
jgi:hypothetical protein